MLSTNCTNLHELFLDYIVFIFKKGKFFVKIRGNPWRNKKNAVHELR